MHMHVKCIHILYHFPCLSLVLIAEVERFDTQHPGNASNSNDHQNHMNVALEGREIQMHVTTT